MLGIVLILAGQLPLDNGSEPSLPPIPPPSLVAETGTPDVASPTESTPEPTPDPTPVPADWVATQIQIESVGLNVAVQRLAPGQPLGNCCAFLLSQTADPGRGTNSYIAAHALLTLFKGLWNVQLGAEVLVLMSDGQVLHYRVTEVHPNVSCPDPDAEPMTPPIPLDLLYSGPGCAEGGRWTAPTDHERLTLQTSQGFNRNWGELIVVALPIQP
ncbi:MAG: sortase domain-containing protein [Candidatus Limnocylindria bacterium]